MSRFCKGDQVEGNEPSSRSIPSVNDMLDEMFPSDLLDEPFFCNLCKTITYDAVRSSRGFQHVQDVMDLYGISTICSLCHLISLALIESARHGPAGEKITTLDSAIAEFESRWRENGMEIPASRPVVLKLSGSLPNILNIRTVFTSMTSKTADHYRRCSHHSAYLILHGSEGIDQKPVIPRPGLLELFDRTRIGLWGWTPDRKELAPLPEAKLPDRVLDIRNCFKKGERIKIRLIETASLPQGSYAALSYCWGGYREFVTETHSYQDRCNGIATEELPPLFKHACFLACYWDIPYIWIDALCIIQDCRADWEEQAAKMAGIYRNCAVRIAPTSAKDPTVDFLSLDPIVPSIRLRQVETTRSGSGSKHANKYYVTLPKRYEKDVDLGQLNSRAWVLQERLLAPRSVHFCKDHVYFETDRWGFVGEDMVSQFELRYTNIAKDGMNRAGLMQKRITSANYDDRDDTSDSWLKIAELYSSCQITYKTDKLLALAGLIQDRQDNGKYPYLGAKNYLGMWEPTLHEDILWVSTSRDDFHFLDDLKLPTWAWIAYEGSIEFLKTKDLLENRAPFEPRPFETSNC